jgi:hypothetical protein
MRIKSHTHMAQRRSMVVHIVSAVADRQQLVERLHMEGSVRQHSTLRDRAFNHHTVCRQELSIGFDYTPMEAGPMQVVALRLRAAIPRMLKSTQCKVTLGAALVPDVKHSTAAPLSTARSVRGAPLCRLISCCAGTACDGAANFSKASPAGWRCDVRVHSQPRDPV